MTKELFIRRTASLTAIASAFVILTGLRCDKSTTAPPVEIVNPNFLRMVPVTDSPSDGTGESLGVSGASEWFVLADDELTLHDFQYQGSFLSLMPNDETAHINLEPTEDRKARVEEWSSRYLNRKIAIVINGRIHRIMDVQHPFTMFAITGFASVEDASRVHRMMQEGGLWDESDYSDKCGTIAIEFLEGMTSGKVLCSYTEYGRVRCTLTMDGKIIHAADASIGEDLFTVFRRAKQAAAELNELPREDSPELMRVTFACRDSTESFDVAGEHAATAVLRKAYSFNTLYRAGTLYAGLPKMHWFRRLTPTDYELANGAYILEREKMPGFQFDRIETDEQSLDYALYVPRDYFRNDESANKKQWPLVVFLHGRGESGTDGAKMMVHGPPKSVLWDAARWPCLILMPQKPTQDSMWEDFAPAVMAAIARVQQDYRIDEDRISLTGLSQGGHGTWALGAMHPGFWSALAPVCGHLRPLSVNDIAPHVKDLPIWCFHGVQDDIVLPEDSDKIIAAIKAQGGNPKYTLFPDANHNAWDPAYMTPALPNWLLGQKRGKK